MPYAAAPVFTPIMSVEEKLGMIHNYLQQLQYPYNKWTEQEKKTISSCLDQVNFAIGEMKWKFGGPVWWAIEISLC